MFWYQLVWVKRYGKYLIFVFHQNINHRRHGYDMSSDLLLLQEQIDITLWLLVKHYRWVTKGFGDKSTLGKILKNSRTVMTTWNPHVSAWVAHQMWSLIYYNPPKKSFYIPPFCMSLMLSKCILKFSVVITFPLCWFRKQLEELEEARMLRGQLEATQQLALLSSHDDLAQALEGAFFVQVTLFPPQATRLSVSPA